MRLFTCGLRSEVAASSGIFLMGVLLYPKVMHEVLPIAIGCDNKKDS